MRHFRKIVLATKQSLCDLLKEIEQFCVFLEKIFTPKLYGSSPSLILGLHADEVTLKKVWMQF